MARIRLTVVVALALLGSAAASAGVFADLYRGINLLSVPSGGPINNLGDGTLVNGERVGLLRFVQNYPGRGWDFEFSRVFGNDSTGRPEILNYGPWEVELDGAIDVTAGYTNRGYLAGNLSFTVSDLSYDFRTNIGAQDATLSGTLDVLNNIKINQFGFYTAEINVRNTDAELTLDGVVVNENQDVPFDIGPIQVEGNIFFDALIAGLRAVGVDTEALEQLTPDSPIDRIADEIERQIRGTQIIPDAPATAQVKNPATLLLNHSDTIESSGLLATSATTVAGATEGSVLGGTQIPEPATMLMLLIGVAGLRRR